MGRLDQLNYIFFVFFLRVG